MWENFKQLGKDELLLLMFIPMAIWNNALGQVNFISDEQLHGKMLVRTKLYT